MALTIRERSSGGSGTLQRPLELPIDLNRVAPAPILRRFVLGYGGVSSTAVYGITCEKRTALQVNRRSEDRLAVHVEVALLEAGSRRRVAALVERADGTGTEVTLEPGRYLLVASLLVAEHVELELEIRAAVVGIPLRGRSEGRDGSTARPQLRAGEAMASGGDQSRATVRRPLLQGQGGGNGDGALVATAIDVISGRLNGAGGGLDSSIAEVALFHWIDLRGRAMGPLVTINPSTWNREPVRGITDELQLRLTDRQGGPLNLQGMNVALEVWDQRRYTRYGVYAMQVVDAAGGRVNLSLDGALVATLPAQACWDLRVQEPASGRVVYLLQGVQQPLTAITLLS